MNSWGWSVSLLVSNMEFLGSMLFPKQRGFDIEVKRYGREREWVRVKTRRAVAVVAVNGVEVEMKRMA